MIISFFLSTFVLAQGPEVLTLEKYLESVKKQSSEAKALVYQVEAAQVNVKQAELGLSPELFAEYNVFDDRTPPLFPFSPNRTNGNNWKLGIQKQTTFGLSGQLYFENRNAVLGGVDPNFFPLFDYSQGRAVLELKQSLWRNGFGEQTRSNLEADISAMKADLENKKFQLKKLLLEAENTYWSMVTYNQIVALQEENAERAKKLSSWMTKQGRMKLSDDVDVMQSQTAYEMRQLELETSRQDRNAMARVFNTLRGNNSQNVEPLEELPAFKEKILVDIQKKVAREDFAALKTAARAQEMKAKSTKSALKPQVDLVGLVASNGLDQRFSGTYQQIENNQFPAWSVGVQVKFPLNFSLSSQLKTAALNEMRAAQESSLNADFQLQQAWQDTLEKRRDYYNVYTRSKDIETAYNTIVQKERKRLQNGRSTTFTLLNLEQTLVATQIQRTKAQLGLLQIQNVLKTFEVSNESI